MDDKHPDRLYCMDKVDRVAGKIFTFFTWFSIIGAIYIAVITVANVLARLLFNETIYGSTDTAALMLAVVALGALPVVTMFNGHIKVELLVERLPEKAQHVFYSFNFVLCAAMMFVISYYTFLKTNKIIAMGVTTQAYRIPHWPFYLLIAVMFAVAGLCALYAMIHLLVTGAPITVTTFSEVRERFALKKKEKKAE